MQFVGKYYGKTKAFFISLDNSNEFEILRPYFLVTSYNRPRKGSINRMDCLVSGKVWDGTQRHGYGYSWSADVYGTLFSLIKQMYWDKLSESAKSELDSWDTHNDHAEFSESLLDELRKLNDEKMRERWG